MSGINNLFDGMRASSTGLTAERIRIDVIARNIANSQTTRVPGTNDPYTRRVVQFAPILETPGGDAIEGEDLDQPLLSLSMRTSPDADFVQQTVTGREAYDVYMEHTVPFLNAVGGSLEVRAEGGHPLIGPTTERWDLVLLVRYPTIEAFLGMATNTDYLAGIGHRTAALEDSRLIPLA